MSLFEDLTKEVARLKADQKQWEQLLGLSIAAAKHGAWAEAVGLVLDGIPAPPKVRAPAHAEYFEKVEFALQELRTGRHNALRQAQEAEKQLAAIAAGNNGSGRGGG